MLQNQTKTKNRLYRYKNTSSCDIVNKKPENPNHAKKVITSEPRKLYL